MQKANTWPISFRSLSKVTRHQWWLKEALRRGSRIMRQKTISFAGTDMVFIFTLKKLFLQKLLEASRNMSMVQRFLWLENWNGEFQLFRKDRQGSHPLYVNKQLECKELCLGMDEEHTESSWFRAGDTEHLTRENKQMRPCVHRQEPPPIHNTWSSQGTSQQDHGIDPPRNNSKTLGKYRGDWGQLANCACARFGG